MSDNFRVMFATAVTTFINIAIMLALLVLLVCLIILVIKNIRKK